jgi:hypothetical protein
MTVFRVLVVQFKAWSQRQYTASIQAPVLPSQGQRWLAANRRV